MLPQSLTLYGATDIMPADIWNWKCACSAHIWLWQKRQDDGEDSRQAKCFLIEREEGCGFTSPPPHQPITIMAHSWVVRELLTASASLHLVKDKENAAVPLSSNIASTPLNDFPFGCGRRFISFNGQQEKSIWKGCHFWKTPKWQIKGLVQHFGKFTSCHNPDTIPIHNGGEG